MTSHPDLTCEQVPSEGEKKIGEQSVNPQAKRVGVVALKIRLFPKPVSRIRKHRASAPVSRHSFCSCFRPEIWRNVAKNWSKLPQIQRQWTVHCMQLSRSYNNYLSQSCQQSTIQPIRSWYQELVSWYSSINECPQAPLCTPSSPELNALGLSRSP